MTFLFFLCLLFLFWTGLCFTITAWNDDSLKSFGNSLKEERGNHFTFQEAEDGNACGSSRFRWTFSLLFVPGSLLSWEFHNFTKLSYVLTCPETTVETYGLTSDGETGQSFYNKILIYDRLWDHYLKNLEIKERTYIKDTTQLLINILLPSVFFSQCSRKTLSKVTACCYAIYS